MLEIAAVLAGYVLGSLPFGYWLPLLLRGEDIRTQGSGNVGATNVFRVYGRGLGLPVALLDVAKGFAAASLGCAFGPKRGCAHSPCGYGLQPAGRCGTLDARARLAAGCIVTGSGGASDDMA